MRVRVPIGWILRAGDIPRDIVASGVSEVLYFTVDWVSPWLVRELDKFIVWVDGGLWGSSLWDVDIVQGSEDGDDISERVQAV